MGLSRVLALVLVLLVTAAPARAAEHPALAKARTLYNAGDFDGAINAAAVSRRVVESADASALVIARSHLERYRLRADPADLASARETLGAIRVAALGPRDQVDLLVGIGQSLYLGELFGAAAELFDTALTRAAMLPPRDRLLLLDWWATALDREAQTRPSERRARVYERIGARMEQELREEPASTVANYWLAVAARGTGDVERAWDAAVAAWVRSTLNPVSAETLRTDLDRLVTQALIPERVRNRPVREQAEAQTALNAEWNLVKEHWK
jgi:hypothetical protein